MKKPVKSVKARVAGWVAPAVLTGSVLFAGCASIPPPTDQLAVTRAAVTDATTAGATEAAPVELKSARDKLDEAEKAMNSKDFERAKRLAEEAQVDAKLAETKANAAKAHKAVESAQESNRVLREELQRNTNP